MNTTAATKTGAEFLNKRGFKIPGLTDDATILKKQEAAAAIDKVASANAGVEANSSKTVQSSTNKIDANTVVDVAARTTRISSYYASNATFIGQDASHLNVDAQVIDAALSAFGSNLLLSNQWIKRIGNTGYQLNFDATGTSTIGTTVAFKMGPSVPMSTQTLPVLGFLIRITSYQGNLGQSGVLSFVGASSLALPTFQIQQENANSVSYVFVPAAIGAMLNTDSQVGTAGVITDTPALTQIANDKIACPATYAPATTLFTLQGTNANIIALPVFISDERAKALRAAAIAGTLDQYYTNLLNNAAALFAAQAA